MSTDHTCHHPHCDNPVPPAMLACRSHWFQLPKHLRLAILANYRQGQERDKRPSREWFAAFHECENFWLGRLAIYKVEAGGEAEFVIAYGPHDTRKILRDLVGWLSFRGMYEEAEITPWPKDEPFTICYPDKQGASIETMLPAEWIEKRGRGYLG